MQEILETLEMEPILASAGRLRKTETAVRETVLGKRNRVSIGQPLATRVAKVAPDNLLRPDDVEYYRPRAHEFNLVELSLTLLPDEGCRFRSADICVDIGPAEDELPLVLRLFPAERMSKRTVKRSSEVSARLGLKGKTLHGIEAGLGEKESTGEEFDAFTAELESFGAQTREAGWRMRMTKARDVPLNATGLKLLLVHLRDRPVTATIRVAAEIDICSLADRWLSYAFKQRGPLALSLEHIIQD
jgi:hypothetical protein